MGKKNEYNGHHIIPKSRSGDKSSNNICRVQKNAHDFFHRYTDKKHGRKLPRTPDEVIAWLVNTFWNGQWHWVEKALANRK